MTNRPLILVTNDDGINSPGLHASAEAVAGLGELLIIAPKSQRTSTGRSFPRWCPEFIMLLTLSVNAVPIISIMVPVRSDA